MLWFGFVVACLVLMAVLVVSALRLVLGWRPSPGPDVGQLIVVLAGASLFAFCYGVWMWFAFEPDDASRTISAAPPLLFATLAMIAALALHALGRESGTRLHDAAEQKRWP